MPRYRIAWTLREPYVISRWLPSKLDIKCILEERFGQSTTTHFICTPSSSPSRMHLLHWQQELSFFFYDVLQHRTLTSINRNRESDEEDECQTRISSWTSYSTEYQMKSNKVMAGLLLKMGQAAVQVQHLTSAEKLDSNVVTPSHTRFVICIQISVWRRLLNISFLNNLLALLIPSCTRLLASA